MEALMLFLDAIAILILVYGALIDDRRPRNAPQRSLFRYVADDTEAESPAKPRQGAGSRSGSRIVRR